MNDKVRLDKEKLDSMYLYVMFLILMIKKLLKTLWIIRRFFDFIEKMKYLNFLKKKNITESEQKFLFNFINLKFFRIVIHFE